MVTDSDASAAASDAACSPSNAPTPHIDFTGDLLHDTILDHLLGAVVSLFVSIATLLVGAGGAAVEGLHGRRLGEIIVVRELHWAERGAALLHATTGGGLSAAVVLVDAPRHGGGPPQLMVAIQLIRQLSHVWRQLFITKREKLVVWRVEDLLESAFVEDGRSAGHYFLTGLLHLHKDGDDEQDQNHAGGDADYSAVGLCDLMKESLGLSLWDRNTREMSFETTFWITKYRNDVLHNLWVCHLNLKY